MFVCSHVRRDALEQTGEREIGSIVLLGHTVFIYTSVRKGKCDCYSTLSVLFFRHQSFSWQLSSV